MKGAPRVEREKKGRRVPDGDKDVEVGLNDYEDYPEGQVRGGRGYTR